SPDVAAIKQSRSYIKAYEDIEFLNRADLRPVRLQLELLKPELLQSEHGIASTIVVFGGTRILPPDLMRARVDELRRQLDEQPQDKELARQLAVAQRLLASAKYYDEARKFAALVSSECQPSGDAEYVIVTGGGPGIMEAANRGAFDVGAKSVGLNITLPHEQYPNPYITTDLCFRFHYFALRKLHFLLRAKALVAFPGGYGTFDELFETLTLVQTRKIRPVPIVLVGEAYWRQAFNVDFLVDEGVIEPEDRELFWFAESAQEIWDGILHWHALNGTPLFPSP